MTAQVIMDDERPARTHCAREQTLPTLREGPMVADQPDRAVRRIADPPDPGHGV